MDLYRPKTVRLAHPEHGIVVCNVDDAAHWRALGYLDESAAVEMKMVKPKRVKIAIEQIAGGVNGEVSL